MASPDPIRKHLLDLLRMKGAHLNFEETTRRPARHQT
jgi:hypothetical protein